MSTVLNPASSATHTVHSLDTLRLFIEDEAELLDQQRFDDWLALYASDAVYWAPAVHDQKDWLTHVSLFYDDRHTMGTRVQRLKHPMLHCQSPQSHCVRVLSNFRLEASSQATGEYQVSSKFVMVEDRTGADQRLFAGRYTHTLRDTGAGLQIALKKVLLTNCDHRLPMLTQPF